MVLKSINTLNTIYIKRTHKKSKMIVQHKSVKSFQKKSVKQYTSLVMNLNFTYKLTNDYVIIQFEDGEM